MSDADYLQFICDQLKASFDIKKVILFGSRAKGDAGQDSDFDGLVIVETDIPFVKRQGLAMAALGPRKYPVDLLVYTQEEADRAASILGSAVYWAQREGTVFLA